MKHYSQKRVVWSIFASVLLPIIVGSIYAEETFQSPEEVFFPFFLAGIALLGILLPKIWWNFVLDRIREIAKAIKETD